MDWNQIEGNWKQFKGKVKEKWGKLTDDDLDTIAGKRDQLVGKLQEKYGMAKDEAEKQINEGASYILGVDAGSTTTKAVLMRKGDDAILASVYLRTSGDPVGASRQCYRQLQ